MGKPRRRYRHGKSDVRYARVPQSPHPCTYCMMYASRGFVYHTEFSAGSKEAGNEFHTHCNCKVVPSWDESGLEGYDKDEWKAQWKAALQEEQDRKEARGGKSGKQKAGTGSQNEEAQEIRRLSKPGTNNAASGKSPGNLSASGVVQLPPSRPGESRSHREIIRRAKARGVAFNEVGELGRELSSEEIIARIAGYDGTSGSCQSLALAYIGEKNGLDVVDFRGGASADMFSQSGILKMIAELDGVVSRTERTEYEIQGTIDLMTRVMVQGKEYCLATGEHTGIVRATSGGFEYLELQSGVPDGNGWFPFSSRGSISAALQQRFGCSATRDMIEFEGDSFPVEKTIMIIDVDSFKGNQEFRDILGYLNTNGHPQS